MTRPLLVLSIAILSSTLANAQSNTEKYVGYCVQMASTYPLYSLNVLDLNGTLIARVTDTRDLEVDLNCEVNPEIGIKMACSSTGSSYSVSIRDVGAGPGVAHLYQNGTDIRSLPCLPPL